MFPRNSTTRHPRTRLHEEDASDFIVQHPELRRAISSFAKALDAVLEKEGTRAAKLWEISKPDVSDESLREYLIHTVSTHSPAGRHLTGEFIASILISGL